MPKYKVTWFARYEAEVVADSEEEAISMTGIYNSEYIGAEGDYAEEIKDEIEVGGNSPPKDEPKVWERYLKKLLDR
jgi:hypothetical protein